MSLIKNCIVVINNGHVIGMHPNQEDAEQQAYELALEWRRQADCGAEVPDQGSQYWTSTPGCNYKKSLSSDN
jgi:hypothetical protein